MLENLAADLLKKGLKGLDTRTLRDCRLLVQRYPQIRETVSPELAKSAAISPLGRQPARIRGTVSPELPAALPIEFLLKLSWSKLVELLAIDDPWKRAFFENECLKGHWSVRQLRRSSSSPGASG